MEITWREEAGADVVDMLVAVRAADGVPEVTAGEPMPRDFRGGRHLVAADGPEVVGYAHVNTDGDAFGNQVVELFVRPDRRRQGIGSALVDEVLTIDGPLRLWSHRDHPGAARIAERRRLARVRELLQMWLGPEHALPEPVWRDGTRVRTFVPGQDETAMVAVNKRAFDWHPEQSQLTVEDVREAEEESWFDPAGFFLAVDAGEHVVGFHWTKVHPDGTGEVYVVGVDPDAQGGGLGRALTLAGLHHLRARGIRGACGANIGHSRDIILYVESDNAPAVAVYTRLGFVRSMVNVQYARH